MAAHAPNATRQSALSSLLTDAIRHITPGSRKNSAMPVACRRRWALPPPRWERDCATTHHSPSSVNETVETAR
jgi:hypothetical protein